MAHVNLLPWRAARRKQREREFYMQLGAAFAVAVVVLLIWISWMNARIDNQNDRNAYLQDQIKQVDVRIAKIKDLEKVRDHLLARKKIIEQLQADRSQMVHLFDELVKTIPSSVRLSGLKQNGQSMSLDGVAQSNASVADYMRNIEASPWMGHVDLRKTENSHDSTRMPYVFGLDVSLSQPKSADAGTPAAPGSAPASASSIAPKPAMSTPAAATSAGADKAAVSPEAGATTTAMPHAAATKAPVKGGTKS